MGRTSISLAILADDSVLPARCRTRASTAVSVARDVKRMPFAVSAISEFPRGGGKRERSFRKGEKTLSWHGTLEKMVLVVGEDRRRAYRA